MPRHAGPALQATSSASRASRRPISRIMKGTPSGAAMLRLQSPTLVAPMDHRCPGGCRFNRAGGRGVVCLHRQALAGMRTLPSAPASSVRPAGTGRGVKEDRRGTRGHARAAGCAFLRAGGSLPGGPDEGGPAPSSEHAVVP